MSATANPAPDFSRPKSNPAGQVRRGCVCALQMDQVVNAPGPSSASRTGKICAPAPTLAGWMGGPPGHPATRPLATLATRHPPIYFASKGEGDSLGFRRAFSSSPTVPSATFAPASARLGNRTQTVVRRAHARRTRRGF